jgi:hypothetical protein
MEPMFLLLPASTTGAVLRSKAAKSLLVSLCLLFLTAQTAGLSHSHDGDLRLQADCDVCLKLSTDDEAAVDKSLVNTPFATLTSPIFFPPVWDDLDTPVARARAPPSV